VQLGFQTEGVVLTAISAAYKELSGIDLLPVPKTGELQRMIWNPVGTKTISSETLSLMQKAAAT
jgi:hypothetical protein